MVWYHACDIVYDQTIIAVSPKWAELNNGLRFEIKTGRIDGGRYSSPATVFSTQWEYEDSMERRRLLKILQKETQMLDPCNHRVSELRRALDVLHIPHSKGQGNGKNKDCHR